jgi:hypothetical protein
MACWTPDSSFYPSPPLLSARATEMRLQVPRSTGGASHE